MKKSLFICFAMMATALSHGATLLPDDSSLVFKFDYSADSDTPFINNKGWSWGHWGSEKPVISNGVGQFSNGGPYTNNTVSFDVNNFTLSFDIGSVTNEGAVCAFAEGGINGNNTPGKSGFYIKASGNSISLMNATQGYLSATAILTANIDLTKNVLSSIVIINNAQGSAIYSGNTLLASSTNHVSWTGSPIESNFSIGNVKNAGPNKIGAKLDNVTLYSGSAAIPEPTTASLALLGAFGLLLRRRR